MSSGHWMKNPQYQLNVKVKNMSEENKSIRKTAKLASVSSNLRAQMNVLPSIFSNMMTVLQQLYCSFSRLLQRSS